MVPMHTLDSLFEKCPNCSIRVILLIWLGSRVTPPREIRILFSLSFLFYLPYHRRFFLLFSPFFLLFSFFFILLSSLSFWVTALFFMIRFWYGWFVVFSFFFFPQLVVTFFVYCYGIVIVLNFLLIRHKYWKAFERRFYSYV